jgi:hypothetical protein
MFGKGMMLTEKEQPLEGLIEVRPEFVEPLSLEL